MQNPLIPIGLLFLRAIYFALKLFIIICIFWGALRSLTPTDAAYLGELLEWAKGIRHAFPGGVYVAWIAENWLALAVLYFFVNTLRLQSRAEEFRQTSNYMKMFAALIMNYLHIGAEIDPQVSLRERGWWKTWKNTQAERLMCALTGGVRPDPFLAAKPKRYDERVTLEKDLKEFLK